LSIFGLKVYLLLVVVALVEGKLNKSPDLGLQFLVLPRKGIDFLFKELTVDFVESIEISTQGLRSFILLEI
jgi:hypothetical protein